MRAVLSSFVSAIVICGSLIAQEAPPGLVARDQRYKLQAQDIIEVHYRYTPEYDQTITVEPDGFVSLNLIGGIKVSGLTLDEARSELIARAGMRLQDPEISILLKDYQKPHFFVAGEVVGPGRFDLRGPTSAVEAVAIAGGFKTASAKHSQVILYRRAGAEVGEARIINLKKMMTSSGIKEDLQLQPGDLLVVPQNQVSKIERYIKWANLGMYFNPIP